MNKALLERDLLAHRAHVRRVVDRMVAIEKIAQARGLEIQQDNERLQRAAEEEIEDRDPTGFVDHEELVRDVFAYEQRIEMRRKKLFGEKED